jgi:hypothetical protein
MNSLVGYGMSWLVSRGDEEDDDFQDPAEDEGTEMMETAKKQDDSDDDEFFDAEEGDEPTDGGENSTQTDPQPASQPRKSTSQALNKQLDELRDSLIKNFGEESSAPEGAQQSFAQMGYDILSQLESAKQVRKNIPSVECNFQLNYFSIQFVNT